MIRYISINNKNSIYFHYFPFTTSWKKAANNIDARWNQNVIISEIKDIEIVTPDEKQKLVTEFNQTELKYDENTNAWLGTSSAQ